MTSENYGLIDPSGLPSELTQEHDLTLHDLGIDINDRKFEILFDIDPQRYSGEIPIGSDIIHVSGGDRKDDFEDDPLAPPKPSCRSLSRLIYFNSRNLEKLRRIYQSKLLN